MLRSGLPSAFPTCLRFDLKTKSLLRGNLSCQVEHTFIITSDDIMGETVIKENVIMGLWSSYVTSLKADMWLHSI